MTGSRRTRLRGAAMAAALVALVTSSCSSGSDDAAPGSTTGSPTSTTASSVATETVPAATFPGSSWPIVDAATAGFDQASLDALSTKAEAAGSSCLVVTKDGSLVDEHYWNGMTADTPREAFSVTKSVTSTLVGIAQDDGDLSIDDSASDYIPPWRGTDAAVVTVKDLLSNDSGRQWSLSIDYRDMAITAKDKTAFAIALTQEHSPGKVWAYNNSAIQTLDAVMKTATGEPMKDFGQTKLLDPIGMSHSSLSLDAAGNTLAFMGLKTTCLDLARFGYLALHDGNWDGAQIVSKAYIEEATGAPSTPLNAAYGYLWWLNREGPIGSPSLATTGRDDAKVADGQLDPKAPVDVFWALGLRNQIVAVIPSEGIVAVRMGAAPPKDAPFTQTQLTDGVLDARAGS